MPPCWQESSRTTLLESVGFHRQNTLHNAAYVTTLSLIPSLPLILIIVRSGRPLKQKVALISILTFIFFFRHGTGVSRCGKIDDQRF